MAKLAYSLFRRVVLVFVLSGMVILQFIRYFVRTHIVRNRASTNGGSATQSAKASPIGTQHSDVEYQRFDPSDGSTRTTIIAAISSTFTLRSNRHESTTTTPPPPFCTPFLFISIKRFYDIVIGYLHTHICTHIHRDKKKERDRRASTRA